MTFAGGLIPNDPVAIVVPKSLIGQYITELRRFLEPNTFDILPYIGQISTRETWWSRVWTQSNLPSGRCILLAAAKVSTT